MTTCVYILSPGDHISLLTFAAFNLFSFFQQFLYCLQKNRVAYLFVSAGLLEKNIQKQSSTNNERIEQCWPSQIFQEN